MNPIERIYSRALVWKKWQLKEPVKNAVRKDIYWVQVSISLEESEQKSPSEVFGKVGW